MRILSALLCVALWGGFSAGASAQRALSALGEVEAERLPERLVTLRPDPELALLAREVAGVLELRTGRRVEVGSAPPPGVLEAVPTGHVALSLRDGGSVLLVLGAPGGRSVSTAVDLRSEGIATRARAVALGVETLCDEATDLSRQSPPTPASTVTFQRVEAPAHPALAPADEPTGEPVAVPPVDRRAVDREPAASEAPEASDPPTAVEPLFYLRAFAGASTASVNLMSGLGLGLGLCVRGHCLYLAGEVPSQLAAAGRTDARYRYTTFTSGFYTRPWEPGVLTPGATLGFFTRVGQFNQDMGLTGSGLETDLGARGSVELALELLEGADLMAEAGVDLTLDRLQLAGEHQLTKRTDRFSPWAQLALRYRLE